MAPAGLGWSAGAGLSRLRKRIRDSLSASGMLAPPRGRSSRLPVLLVRDVLAPRHRAPGLVVLLHRDVDHEAGGRRAVPVVLARLEEDAVAGPDLLDRPTVALAEADALGDEDGLAVRVGVPGG